MQKALGAKFEPQRQCRGIAGVEPDAKFSFLMSADLLYFSGQEKSFGNGRCSRSKTIELCIMNEDVVGGGGAGYHGGSNGVQERLIGGTPTRVGHGVLQR